MATRKTPSRKAASASAPRDAVDTRSKSGAGNEATPLGELASLIEDQPPFATTHEEPDSEAALLGEMASLIEDQPPSAATRTEPLSEAADQTLEDVGVAPEKPASPARFHFFIIDSGWKSASAQVIRENFKMIREFQNDDPLYVLNQAQSIALIQAHPDWIGKDPIILVHDLHATKNGPSNTGYCGFRLCLGLIKNSAQALTAMQEFLRFVHSHRRCLNLEKEVQKELHREGLEGAIEVLRDGAQDLAG